MLIAGCSPSSASSGVFVAFLQRLAQRSAPPPRLQRMYFPAAMFALAGSPLQPALGAAVDVARQKIPARAPFPGVGLCQRRHRTPRAGVGVLPWLAGILIALGQDVGGGIAGKGKIGDGGRRPAWA